MAAGYSKRPLAQKLGIKEGTRVTLLQAPAGYDETLGPLPEGVRVLRSLRGPQSFVQFFATRRRELEARFPALKRALDFQGTVWISWPKQASGMATDLNENVVRGIGLAHGLVDVKVCAVDETWSGLKFVYRLQDRP